MAAFSYQGRSMDGRLIKGQLDASSESEARVKLRAQKIVPIKVFPKGMEQKAGFDLLSLFTPTLKVKSKDLQVFSRQFATMISSGIPIVQSLDILSQQTVNKGFKDAIIKIKTNLEAGRRLTECLALYPQVFDKMYVNMVKAGEDGGVLDTILNRIAAYLEKSSKLKNKVIGAMWYPAGVLIISLLVIIGMLKFVIPKFEKLFSNSGKALPGLTQMVVGASHFMQDYFIYVIGGIFIFVFALQYFYKTPEGKDIFDRIFLKLPIFGPLLQKSAIARFTRLMSTMLSCGVGILESLDICAQVVGNTQIEKAIQRVRVAVADGKSIIQPMAAEPLIPAMVTQMVGVGEASGSMDSMFTKIADFYEEEVDYAVGALTSIMEPLMMVVLGGIVAVMVISMYLPIFSMGDVFK